MCICIIHWGKDTQLVEPVCLEPYFLYLKVVLCRLDISEFLVAAIANNNNNNNNNIYLLHLDCHPVAVVILHVHKYEKQSN